MRLLSKQVNVVPYVREGRNCVYAGRSQWDTFTRTVPDLHRLSWMRTGLEMKKHRLARLLDPSELT